MRFAAALIIVPILACVDPASAQDKGTVDAKPLPPREFPAWAAKLKNS